MKFFLLVLAVFGSLVIPNLARADWVVLSAAAKCDKDHGIFTLVPVVRTSSEEYNISAPKDFTEFEEKNNQSFNCKLGKKTVSLSISRKGPQERGQGQGGGVIIIESFSIDGKNIINHRTNFLWNTMNKPVLTQITVKKGDAGFEENYCYSDGFSWDKQHPIKDMKCQSSIEPD